MPLLLHRNCSSNLKVVVTNPEKKGQAYGWASISYAIGSFSGLLVASAFSPAWQVPLLINSVIVFVFLVAYGVIGKNYAIGSNEEEFLSSIDKGAEFSYDYRITWRGFN